MKELATGILVGSLLFFGVQAIGQGRIWYAMGAFYLAVVALLFREGLK